MALAAQGEFMNWFFGQNVGVKFVNGFPEPYGQSNIVSGEGIASISDAAGNLLFYTNGVRVWGRNHAVMMNGQDLLGDLSSTQGVLIVPRPGNDDQYYIFTAGGMEAGTGDLRYSLVDMSLAGGNGDVVPTQKNILLSTRQAEKIVSAKASQCGIWVITHPLGGNAFEARLVTNAGIADPVVSNAGVFHLHPVGTMKMSADGRKIVAAVTSGDIDVLDFNPATGEVSNALSLPVSFSYFSYSACFSPDGTKVYVVEGKSGQNADFYQFDLLAPDPASSKTKVGSTTTGIELQTSDIQRAPDGKLYFSRVATSCIGVIPDPNLKAPLCGFNDVALCNIGMVGLCLPNTVTPRPRLANLDLGPDTTLCPGETLAMVSPPVNATYLWSTGATTPSIIADTSGRYWLQLDNGECKTSDTIIVKFTGTRVELQKDTAICVGSSFTVDAAAFSAHLWQDGATQPAFTIAAPGLYWLEAEDRCGVRSRDSLLVTYREYDIIPADAVSRCSNDSIIIPTAPGYTNYSWGPDYFASNLQSRDVRVAPPADTQYYVRALVMPGCYAYDTVLVNVLPASTFSLGADTLICPGNTVQLAAPAGYLDYRWHDGSSGLQFSTQDEGAVWLDATDGQGCTSRDSLVITFKDCPFNLWVPTAFTPNRDGNNDLFRASYQGLLLKYELVVFNRWGERVFASTQPSAGWDGRIGGKEVDTGVYVWVCHYHFARDIPRTQKGTVTLIR